ncbi:glycoside hydrolase family 3 N-terminal domain-containing protein, partial [Cobetia sp. SIMBA_158]
AEITWVTPQDVKKYHLGSVLNGGGTFLHNNRNASVSDWVSFMDELYLASMDTSQGGLAIPVTYGIDAVHGNNKFIGATLYPHNIGLGATRN